MGSSSTDGVHPHWMLLVRQFGCNVSKTMDWEGRSNYMATTFTGYYTSGLFLWGCVKDNVYSIPVPDADALAAVTEEMLQKTWREIEYRIDILRATKGIHIEDTNVA
jgi:hypothetical protein